MVADAVAVQTATRRRAGPSKQIGIAFEGQATVTGAVAGGSVGQLTQGGTKDEPRE